MQIDSRMAHFLTDEGRKEYSAWLRDPMTQRVLSLSDASARPLGLAQVTSESALYNLGICVGMSALLNFIRGVDTAASNLAGDDEDVASDFGAEKILAKYYKLPKAEKGSEAVKGGGQ